MKNNLLSLTYAPLFALFCVAFSVAPLMGQIPISSGGTVSQNFSTLGTNAVATLPSGWKVDKSTNARTLATYGAAVTATERAGGTNLSTTAGNGIYNFGSSETDRAVGGLSSGSASKSVNLYVALENTGGSAISGFNISYNAERYRNGSNLSGFSIQLYYSTNGSTWTSAGANFLSSFAPNADNTGSATVPIQTISVTSQNLPISVPAGSTIYLAWNYSVTTGSTTSNAQAVGVSDIQIAADGGAVPSIFPSGSFAAFSTFAGTASASQSLSIGAANLTAGITATAPTGFQVSSDNVTFGPTASLPAIGGTLYARVAAPAAGGEVATSITLSSTGATDAAVPVIAAVRPNPVPLPYGPETFTTSSFPWYTYTVAGVRNWNRLTAGGNSFMEINGYDTAVGAVPANAWLILGPFDFPAASNLVASFNLQRAFNDAGSDAEFTFKYSTDYAGIDNPSSSTWSDIAFTKPAAVTPSSTVFTPSGAVTLPATLSGETGVYLAFQLAATSPTATSRWRVDDFEVFTSLLPVVSVVVNPSTVDEGSTATGTVTLPSAAALDTNVTVTSADPALVRVNGSSSTVVTIPAGFADAQFDVATTRNFQPGPDVPVQVTAESQGYTFGQAIVTVRNIDRPSTSLTSGGYTQNFASFSAATPDLPLGWSATGPVLTFPATNNAWGEGSGSGFRGAANVFGYQHTGSTGTLQQILTLRNDTGAQITDIVISYLGRVARVAEGRTPAYAVTVNGTAINALAYSTVSGSDATLTAAVSGLSIAPNQTIEIIWTSERGGGGGSSRQIGIGEMSITVGSAVLPPSVASLAVPLATIGQNSAEASADVTADGGSIITARGFVYAQTSVNSNPTIGGTGVTNLPDATADVGAFSSTLSSLVSGTQYSVRAYAVNAEGTSYTPARTFTTLGAPIGFTGNYAESFATYTGTLPTGWTALSSLEVQAYGGAWGTGSAGGFRGVGTNTGAVIGYQPTSTTGTLTIAARFVNNTASPINTLYVRYLGRVARADQPNQPAWAVSLNGTPVADLAYSTGNTAGPEGAPADQLITAAITGLSIPAGAEFNLTWVSDRGTQGGTSRQIGLADFQVSTSAIPDPAINITGSLTPFSTVVGTASAAQSFNASGVGLTGNITVTAPTNYEVSLDNSAFAASVSLAQVNGTVASTPVYVRIAASAPIGNPAGTVSLASTGAVTQTIAVTGTVSSAASAYDTWASGFGLDPATNGAPGADPDGDSFTNEQEYAFGTSPIVANGALLTTGASGGNLVVTWLERSDVTYNVQSTANLATTAFANDGSVTVQAGPAEPTPPAGYTRKQFSVPTTGRKFYRVSATTP